MTGIERASTTMIECRHMVRTTVAGCDKEILRWRLLLSAATHPARVAHCERMLSHVESIRAMASDYLVRHSA